MIQLLKNLKKQEWALAALSVGLCLGLGLEEMARAMRTVQGVKGSGWMSQEAISGRLP